MKFDNFLFIWLGLAVVVYAFRDALEAYERSQAGLPLVLPFSVTLITFVFWVVILGWTIKRLSKSRS